MRTTGLPVLSRILDGQLRAGDQEIDLVRTMNEAIGSSPGAEIRARREALLSAAGALHSLISRRLLKAAVTGRWYLAWKLHEARWDVAEFAIDLGQAELDPDADILRTQLLQLLYASRTEDPAGLEQAVLGAMNRVAYAGTTPLN